MAFFALSRLNSTRDLEKIGVSGEFRYFGPAFSSVARVRPVNAITLPASLAMGNMTRLRNLEYMAEERASGVGRRASDFGGPASSLVAGSTSPPCPSTERPGKDRAPALSGFVAPLGAWD